MALRAVSTIREDFVQGGGFAPSSPSQRRKATLASVLIRCYQVQGDLFPAQGSTSRAPVSLLVWSAEGEALDSCAPKTGGHLI